VTGYRMGAKKGRNFTLALYPDWLYSSSSIMSSRDLGLTPMLGHEGDHSAVGVG
jgi:hypothetical protein